VLGISLFRRLLEVAPEKGWSVYLLGAKPEVVAALVERLRRERPGLRIAGHRHGFMSAEEESAVVAEIARARPDLLFVAMGSPRQEYWLEQFGAATGARVTLGVGGSFDVLAGVKRDTPDWARGRGLEWLYRLWLDPRNLWKRYLITNSWFLWRVFSERLRRALARVPAP
jgi:N-acetylglucosaminyldiphosphoundecaprenol N-acetyl-beta-D-mannosaminyltransferase